MTSSVLHLPIECNNQFSSIANTAPCVCVFFFFFFLGGGGGGGFNSLRGYTLHPQMNPYILVSLQPQARIKPPPPPWLHFTLMLLLGGPFLIHDY